MARDEYAKVNLTFRVPEGLRMRLEAAALAGQRSLNSEMIARLESSFEGGDVLRALFGAKPVTAQLIRSMLEIFDKIQRIAQKKGLKESETRKALRAAFDLLGSVYFFAGEPIPNPPDGYIGSMDRPPVALADKPPPAMGYDVAHSIMEWNDDLPLDEWGDPEISSFWTGDGTQRELVEAQATPQPEPPPSTPPDEILLGDNSAGHPAEEEAADLSRGHLIEGADKID